MNFPATKYYMKDINKLSETIFVQWQGTVSQLKKSFSLKSEHEHLFTLISTRLNLTLILKGQFT